MIPAPNPRWQNAREAHAERIRKGTDKLSAKPTTTERLSLLEHQLTILAITPGYAETMRQVESGARDIIENEKLSAVLALRGEKFSKAAHALSDSEAQSLATRLEVEHFVGINAEAREWLMSLLHPSKAAEFTFELLPLSELEHVRVSRIVRGRQPQITIMAKGDAPEPNETSIFVEGLPESISRASALAAWRQSGEPLPEL